MDYGRVDVYWPDGPIESYRLDKPAVAVGRSSGNDIALDTNAISRYHITITFKNDQALLEDLQSVNGTYVDGIRLAANEPYVLRGGEEIQIGDVRLIYHPATEVAVVPEDTTQRVTLSQLAYRVELQGPDMGVAPGAHVQSALVIENLGDEADHYFIEVDGLPRGWARVDRTELEIGPGEQGQAIISFKPLRRSESQPGDHPFVVRVRSRLNPAQTSDVSTVLRVLPFSGFGIALGTSRIEEGAAFKLYVHNQGNAPLVLNLQAADPFKVLAFHLSKTSLVLGPGERQTVPGTIRPRRRRLFGPEYEREFVLSARSQDASGFLAAVPGTYVDRALLPSWAPALIVPLTAVLALLLGAVALWLFANIGEDQAPASQPVITNFAVDNPAIALGASSELAWTVQDADVLELRVVSGGESLQTIRLDPDAQTYRVTPEQTGRYEFTLEARSGQRAASDVVYVDVQPVVSLEITLPHAAPLVRNVYQPVLVRWSVLGAIPRGTGYSIWIEGTNSALALLGAPQALSGSQQIDVLVTDSAEEWRVTLFAEGWDGVMATATQSLGVENPTCNLQEPTTTVRSGPGDTYSALAILPPQQSASEGTVSLSPTARDPGGEWLQVSIGVTNPRTGWVRLGDFVCTNFDPGALQSTDDFPPLPASTPSTTEDELGRTPTLAPVTQTAITPTITPDGALVPGPATSPPP